MITYPSFDDLIDKVDSPYTLIIMAARRARQLNNKGTELLEEYKSRKPVSRSLEEIAEGKIIYRRNSKKGIK